MNSVSGYGGWRNYIGPEMMLDPGFPPYPSRDTVRSLQKKKSKRIMILPEN